MILKEKTLQELGLDSDTCSKKKKVYKQCDYCGEITLSRKEDILRSRKTTNKDCCKKKDCVVQKKQETNMVLFGVKNYTESQEFKEKSKISCNEIYDRDNYAQTKECQDRRKQNCLARYGVDNYAKTDECKEKTRKTNSDRYNEGHFSKTKEFKEKVRNTTRDHFDVDHYSQTDKYKEQCKETCRDRYNEDHYSKTREWKERVKETCRDRYNKDHYSKTREWKEKVIQTNNKRYGVPNCYFLCKRKGGKTEEEIQTYLNSFGFDFKPNREILEGKEIDLFDRGIGLEYCGLYWHNELSPQPRLKYYHHSKYQKCLESGVRLVTIFEDEWKQRQNQCKNILKSILGANSKKYHARKCIIKSVEKQQGSDFCRDYHLQGSPKFSKQYFGIFYDNELLGVLSLGLHHRSVKKGEMVLDRLCFIDDVQVLGGASKLFSEAKKWAISQNVKQIITWSDNRWTSGDVYPKMGFVLDVEYGPDYSYVDLKNTCRKSKQSQKKMNTDCPKDKTEKEWAIQNSLARIWDCGKKRWIVNI